MEIPDWGAQGVTIFDLNGDLLLEDGTEVVVTQGTGASPDSFQAATGPARASYDDLVTVSATGTATTISGRGSCRSEVPIRGDLGDFLSSATGFGGRAFTVVLTEPGSFNLAGSVKTAPTPRRSAGTGENRGFSQATVDLDHFTLHFVSSADPIVRSGGSVPVRGSGLLEPGSHFLTVDCVAASPRLLEPPKGSPLTVGLFDAPVGEASWEVTFTVSEGVCNGAAARWVGGADGAFDDPASWNPPIVPAADQAQCDVALYRGGGATDVDLSAPAAAAARGPRIPGDRSVGRLEVAQNAQVNLQGGTLDVAATTLTTPAVQVENAELTVGPAGNLEASGETRIKQGGRLLVQPGSFIGGTLRVGGGSPGHQALFNVDAGGTAVTSAAFLGDGGLAGATVRGFATDGPSTWTTETLTVGSAGSPHPSILGVADVGNLVTNLRAEIGQVGPGEVLVLGGQSAAPSSWLANGDVTIGPRGVVELTEGAAADFGTANVDGGKLTVSGVGSDLDVHDALVVQGGGSGGKLRVEAGATVTVTNRLTVGRVGGASSSTGLVAIRNGTLLSGDAQIGNFGGRGIVEISGNGSLGTLSNAEVGTAPDSGGLVALEIDQPTDDPIWLVQGNLIVGADGGSGVGLIDLEGGLVDARGSEGIRIRANGELTGSGDLRGRVENAGLIDGTFRVDGNYVQLPGGRVQGAITSPPPSPLLRSPAGTLRTFARLPPPPEPPQGPIIVTGDATLDGTLVLQFLNGFAPRAGDRFDVIEVAGAVTGGFANVLVRGLAPGAEPAQNLAAGKLSLTFPEARVALPTVSLKAKPTLKETKKKGAKVKFTRAGDASQPLLVSYAVGGLASNGLDYVELPGTLEIPAGKKSATLLVKPFADGIEEEPETIELELLPGDDYAPSLFSKVTIELVDKKK